MAGYVGQIISDPSTANVERVANAWYPQTAKVDIDWRRAKGMLPADLPDAVPENVRGKNGRGRHELDALPKRHRFRSCAVALWNSHLFLSSLGNCGFTVHLPMSKIMQEPNMCSHGTVVCLNQYELIRKYRCTDCGAVMMCSCDEAFGRRFLAHQLSEGCQLDTQESIPVTHDFQPGLCNGCRGLPREPAPSAAVPGRTSKIKRFYWRELFFHETEAFADWQAAHPQASTEEAEAARKRIELEVLDSIKALHSSAPLYDMREQSQADVLARCEVEIERLYPEYADSPKKGAVVLLDGQAVSAEAFVERHYAASGWSAMPLESLPLHALFGVMLWLLIEDPADPKNRMVAFGSRTAFEARTPGEQIWTYLPEDFGTPGYGRRRSKAIDEHFARFFKPNGYADTDQLLWLFDYWRQPSERLRQYLWAHRDADIDRARRLVELLAADAILAILRYLVDDYWGRYLGWPDLLLFRNAALLFAEVKSSSDRLSAEQMRWIADNHALLKLPFRLVKLHRPSRQAPAPMSRSDAAHN